MAKVLISLLGTGKMSKGDDKNNHYQTTDYKLDNKIYNGKTLVAEPIIEHFKIDKVFFLGTKTSMWDNLCEIFEVSEDSTLEILEKKEQGALLSKELSCLNRSIDTKLGSSGSECIIIHDAEDQDGLWELFEHFLEILEKLSGDDEVYFDITHLFRSVSVLSLVMAQFGKITHDIKVKGLFYGLLKEGEVSPIMDLSIFLELLDWARAIKNLQKSGNSFELQELIDKSSETKEIKNSFKNFSNALSISDIGAIQQAIKQLKGKVAKFEDSNNKIIHLVLDELKEFINRLDIDNIALFQYELAKWYDTKNYAMGYLTLTEAIISAVCIQNSLNPEAQDDREEAKQIIYSWRHSTQENKKLQDAYFKINNIRINIAHKTSGNSSRVKSSSRDSVENFPRYIEKVSMLFVNLNKAIKS